MLTCGIDIGSRTIEIAIMDIKKGTCIGHKISDTGSIPLKTLDLLIDSLFSELSLSWDDIHGTVATGYGRKSFVHNSKNITEITCHARGVTYLYPEAGAVIDIGGQDSKVIVLEKNGKVRDFAMNDRCAAGTGRFLEMTSQILEVPLEEMGNYALKAKKSIEISSMCAVFAESEIIGLVARGYPKNEILRGVIASVAKQIAGLAGRVNIQGKVVLTGGVAKNTGLVHSLEIELSTPLIIPEDPQITGALGAALLAADSNDL